MRARSRDNVKQRGCNFLIWLHEAARLDEACSEDSPSKGARASRISVRRAPGLPPQVGEITWNVAHRRLLDASACATLLVMGIGEANPKSDGGSQEGVAADGASAPAPMDVWARAPGRLEEVIRILGALTPLAVVGGPSVADIACSTIAALFLLHAVWQKSFAWLRQSWLLVALALWAYACVRALFAADVMDSISLALPFVRFPIFAAAMQTLVLREPKWRKRIVVVGAFSLGFLALDALLQYATGKDILGNPPFGDRLVAIYEHPWVGTIIAMQFLPVTLALVDRKRYALAAGFGALSAATVLLTGDRMAFLLTLLALALLAFFLRRSWRATIMAALAAIFVFGAIFALDPDLYRRQVVSTIETVKTLPRTHYGVIWESALRISAEYPLFGIGPRAYRTVCLDPAFGPLYPYTPREMRCATHPHNFYLEWLVDLGLVGLGLFLLAFALIVKRLLAGLRPRPMDYAYAALLATFLARLWPIASSTSFHHAWFAVPLWLVIGWALSYHALEQGPELKWPSLCRRLARLSSFRR